MESAHVTGSATDDESATASRRSLSYSDKGIIKCVSAHALASCGIGNNVEGFINHENTRVSDAFTYNADHRLALIDIFSDLAFILMGIFLPG